MAMPETPRTWTLTVCPICANEKTAFSLCEHQCAGDGPTGVDFDQFIEVEVVEKAPTEAERERMLDVIEDMRKRFALIGFEPGPEGLPVLAVADALLREYNRLSEGGDCEDEYEEQSRVEAEAQAREP
jgi:hypothetical protein